MKSLASGSDHVNLGVGTAAAPSPNGLRFRLQVGARRVPRRRSRGRPFAVREVPRVVCPYQALSNAADLVAPPWTGGSTDRRLSFVLLQLLESSRCGAAVPDGVRQGTAARRVLGDSDPEQVRFRTVTTVLECVTASCPQRAGYDTTTTLAAPSATRAGGRYGGSGLGLSEACAVLEEIHRSGGNGAAAHAQM